MGGGGGGGGGGGSGGRGFGLVGGVRVDVYEELFLRKFTKKNFGGRGVGGGSG